MDSIDLLVRDGDLKNLVHQLRRTIDASSEAELSQRLMEVVFPAYGKIKKIREEVKQDIHRNGMVLEAVMNHMRELLIPGQADRSLVVRSVCPSCTSKAERAADRMGRRKTHVNEQPVLEHITKSLLLEGGADQYLAKDSSASLYPRQCGDCGGLLKILNSSNIIRPASHPIIAALSSREKGSGRWAEKLTEAIFDPDSRSVFDWVAFYVLFDISDLEAKDEKTLKHEVRERYGGQLDKGKGSYEDQMHFILLDYIRAKSPFEIRFKRDLDERGKTDNYVDYPKLRRGEDGSQAEYRCLHFDMIVRAVEDESGNFTILTGTEPQVKMPPKPSSDTSRARSRDNYPQLHEIALEGQIKSRRTYDEENNPNSPIFHQFKEEKDTERIAREWTDDQLLVFDLLRKAVRRKLKPQCYDCQSR